MSGRRTPAPVERTAAPTTDHDDDSAGSPLLEQQVAPTAPTEYVVTDASDEETDGKPAEVDAKAYPERPYADAVSDDHRAFLERQGHKLDKADTDK